MRASDLVVSSSDRPELEFEKMSPAAWAKLFWSLGLLKRSIAFYLGDAMIEAERQLGHRAAQVVSAAELSASEQEEFERVAHRWCVSERFWELPWSYHRDVGLDKDMGQALLRKASQLGWSRDQLREARKALCASIDKEEMTEREVSEDAGY